MIASREICDFCGEDVTVGFSVPNCIWNLVAKPDEILCLRCFTRRCDQHLIEWDRYIKFHPVSLKKHLGI
jgi:hypothetical protein